VDGQVSDALRQFRLRSGMTQEGLAERSGVSVRTIRGLETGSRSNPQLASLRRLADAMELTSDERDGLIAAGATAARRPSEVADPGLGVSAHRARPSKTIPRQLPAPPTCFTGRTRELAGLSEALDDTSIDGPAVLISALAGSGGIGKTWLALHWAHRHLDRFPDGQLFTDLRGFSPDSGPLDPHIAVRGFLDALGADAAHLHGDLAQDTARYRSHIADKRMLILLDNAATIDQISPLLPGSRSCTVIVTSRTILTPLLTRHGAHHLNLDILTDTESRELLVRRLGRARVAAEPDAVAELIRLCGRYPLALSIVASHAQAHPDLPLTDFSSELREVGLDAFDDSDPATSLPSVLSWSLRSLTPEQRTAFELLGIAPGPDIGLSAAAGLIGLRPSRARTLLRTLADVSLLTRKAHERYAMHDLVRDYAATTAEHDLADGTREAALRRVIDFYVRAGYAADRIVFPERPPIQLNPPLVDVQPPRLPDLDAALAWFDAEHPTLLAAQRTAARIGWHRAVWQLA
jgi:transcriptional regulator with XRE-family HTH domain